MKTGIRNRRIVIGSLRFGGGDAFIDLHLRRSSFDPAYALRFVRVQLVFWSLANASPLYLGQSSHPSLAGSDVDRCWKRDSFSLDRVWLFLQFFLSAVNTSGSGHEEKIFQNSITMPRE